MPEGNTMKNEYPNSHANPTIRKERESKSRCSLCHTWFPYSMMRGAHDDGRGPGVCMDCYGEIKAKRESTIRRCADTPCDGTWLYPCASCPRNG